jgi:DNA polymerase
MQELGIDKPWIPGDTNRQAATPAVPVAVQSLAAPLSSARGETDFAPVNDLPARSAPRPTPDPAPVVAVAVAVDTVKLAALATDLESLSATIAACQGCGLCKEREQVVIGQGVLRPAIMVIGEAPGDQEDRQGVPFVGRSGMLLDNMLSAIGSSRDKDVYTANIIKCRPPGNRNPRPEEIAACRPFLMRQIELVRPFSILALGRFAAHTLVGGEVPLAEMRQQAYTLRNAGVNIPMVISYHPAYLLRRPADKAAAWQDLQQIKAIAREYV